MAVASLVLGILWIHWIVSVLALIFGNQARRVACWRRPGLAADRGTRGSFP
jgi:hypothetical protein